MRAGGLPAPRKLDTVTSVDHEPARTHAARGPGPAGPEAARDAAPRSATAPRDPRRGRRPVRWQRTARLAVAAGLAVFAFFLAIGMRERRDSTEARGVDRADPEAISESAGIEFVRTDGGMEIFRLEASRQATYSDGSIRFSGGVALTVPPRGGREGFTMTASEVDVADGRSDFTVSGRVRMADAAGLTAQTGRARYREAGNLVTMSDPEGPTTLVRAGLEAVGNEVVQDRDRHVITLDGDAGVRLTGDGGRAAVDVAAPHAIIADADRYMRFDGGTRIRTGGMTIAAEAATAHFGEEENALESMELIGDVRIQSEGATDGGLRESRAGEAALRFEPETRRLEGVTLSGQAVLELTGAEGGRGSRIEGGTMEAAMAPDRGEVVGLDAAGGVRLRLPVTPGDPRQEVRSRTLSATGAPETGLTGLSLDGDIAYRERHGASADRAAFTRTVLADRFEAGVNRGLIGLLDVRFAGGVRFEDETRRAEAVAAAYDLLGGTITLAAGDDGAAPATLVDGDRTIETGGELEVALDGSRVSGSGGVQSVLAPGDGTDGADEDRVPALLQRTQRINIRADTLEYDDDARVVTYAGGARMWQGATSFEGESIAVDHATGGLSVTAARTTIQLDRIDEETGDTVLSRTDAAAGTFVYDDAARHAVYEGSAVLRSRQGDLAAEKIEVFLQTDGRTLDRLASTGGVQLRLDGRWATGETLVYHEAEGRYDLEGAPVEIVEEAGPGDADDDPAGVAPAGADPAEPTCRSTKGLALTFYRASDLVAVDGRDRSRTETSNGPCQPLEF